MKPEKEENTMLRRMTRLAELLSQGPGFTLALPLVIAISMLTACGGGTGDCVATYEFEGEVRKSGYTRAECEEECSIIGRTLSCGFEGSVRNPMAVTGRHESGST
jgi:hypothetical protein